MSTLPNNYIVSLPTWPNHEEKPINLPYMQYTHIYHQHKQQTQPKI
jgi:hypothetical protein